MFNSTSKQKTYKHLLPDTKSKRNVCRICEGDDKEQQTSPCFQHILQTNSMCQVDGNSPDILQYNCDCLFQLCKSCCDEKIISEDILKMSTTKNLKKKCCYKHWKNITKTINGKECSAFERLTIICTFEELIEEYVCHVLTMRQHIFHLEWQ